MDAQNEQVDQVEIRDTDTEKKEDIIPQAT